MQQYLDLLQNILDNGVEKESGRANMPNTIGISNGIIKMNLQDGFPLLTTKKMYLKGIIFELLWMLKGDTNIKYLVDNDVHIWDADAYRWYLKQQKETTLIPYLNKDFENPYSQEVFIDLIKIGDLYNTCITGKDKYVARSYKLGDLGKVYGYQWRNQNGVDQVRDVIEGLKNNPYSRYHIIDGWNKKDFNEMALPPCHLLYQFIVRPVQKGDYENMVSDKKFYLDLNMYQRSCDVVLGVPFNLASMSLLLMLIARTSNMVPGVATWIGGDTHIYLPHIDTVKEQLTKKPYALPLLVINKDLKTLEDILSLTIDDFELGGYQSHEKLNYELFTGLKK